MSYPILSVDKDIAVNQREEAEWKKRGISTVRVNSMSEAMKELGRDSFLFVSINADNIDYMPMLSIMAKSLDTPIFIITSNFDIRDQVEALHNGAEVYAPFQDKVEDNIMSALALLHRYDSQNKRRRKQAKVGSYRELLLLPRRRQVFCRDEEIPMSKTEFDILYYLVANQGIAVTFRQIYQRIWGGTYDDFCKKMVWNHIHRIRKKIADVTGEDSYIVNIRGVGFMLPVKDRR